MQAVSKTRDLVNLLNRAAAALETPGDLTPEDVAELVEDLHVEADAIVANGRPGHAKECMLALALNRALGRHDGVYEDSDSSTAFMYDGLTLPPRACQAVLDFDAHRPVKPFEFRITV